MICKYFIFFSPSCFFLLFYKVPQNTAHPLCHSENLNTLSAFGIKSTLIIVTGAEIKKKEHPSDGSLFTLLTTTASSSSVTLSLSI